MGPTPHRDKLLAAIENPKTPAEDKELLREAVGLYETWIERLNSLSSEGKDRVYEMVELLNWYKDLIEVNLIMKRGSPFLRRQKGQLKLDNSILEEFLIHLIHPDILTGLENMESLIVGPHNAFMSLAFFPRSVHELTGRPNVVIKSKNQDFVIGTRIHYKFSVEEDFEEEDTAGGEFVIAVFAAEVKINLDKTMFQEAAGTAARLKQGVPASRYFVLVEYLDMTPEDTRLTAVDNVLLLRRVKRLPSNKRADSEVVEKQHTQFPIAADVVWTFVKEIQSFIDAILYDPDATLARGSFV